MSAATQYAVITGGNGSLGQAVAAAMLAPDWQVATPGRQELDVRQAPAIARYFADRPVDLLVCAAGMIRDARLFQLTETAWDETWAVNYQGAAWCAEAVLPRMLDQGRGHIILISSFSALHPPPGQAAYAAAKAALLGLVADLAARHGRSNIRVNAVLPGFLETRMTAAVTEPRRAAIAAAHLLGRFNTCRETAKFIRFLHQDLPHTSGQVFQLDSRVNFP
ncbi:MAG: SDR family oxidoreductase [Verrucomicrobiota bacterium]